MESRMSWVFFQVIFCGALPIFHRHTTDTGTKNRITKQWVSVAPRILYPLANFFKNFELGKPGKLFYRKKVARMSGLSEIAKYFNADEILAGIPGSGRAGLRISELKGGSSAWF